MRQIRRFFLVAYALGLIVPAAVSAQFPFVEKPAPIMGPQVTLQYFATSGARAFNTGVGPTTGKVLSSPGMPLLTLYCVDYLHSAVLGWSWVANVSTIGSAANVSNTRLGIAGGGNADAVSRYRKAAWLASNFATNQTLTDWAQIHSAIWTTVIAGNDPNRSYYGQYGSWLAMANEAERTGYQGMNFNDWRVVTDVNADNAGNPQDPFYQPGLQEYLVHVTPEPETIVMLLSGLLVLAVVFRRGGGFA